MFCGIEEEEEEAEEKCFCSGDVLLPTQPSTMGKEEQDKEGGSGESDLLHVELKVRCPDAVKSSGKAQVNIYVHVYVYM